MSLICSFQAVGSEAEFWFKSLVLVCITGMGALAPVAVISGAAVGGSAGLVVAKVTGCATAEAVGAGLGAFGSLGTIVGLSVAETIQNCSGDHTFTEDKMIDYPTLTY